MRPGPQTEPLQPQQNIPRWNLSLRIAFRFWMIYLGLYCLATQIVPGLLTVAGGTGDFDISDPATLWPLRPVIVWTTAHIFHVNASPSVF